jgi:uncharacterized membrane protein YeaQ/YmgE (transglycosylase-associated protein family)
MLLGWAVTALTWMGTSRRHRPTSHPGRVGRTKRRCDLMDLNPGGIIAWIVVGLIAGWLAGQVMKGGGYGLVGDLIVGLIGALIGGFLVGFFVHGSVGLIGSIVVAFIGALILLFILRAVSGNRLRAR